VNKYVIGINGSFHDASVCLLDMSAPEPILLLSEDRHSGVSHHFGFPFKSLEIALERAGDGEIVGVGYSRDQDCFRAPPADYFADILAPEAEAALRAELSSICDFIDGAFPELDDLPHRVTEMLARATPCRDPGSLKKRINYALVKFANECATERNIRLMIPDAEIHSLRHHRTHAATYYASPYDSAAIITWDGRGEFDTTVLWQGRDGAIEEIKAIGHPRSLGRFYELCAEHIGFGRIEGPGKLMGLAAYGDDRYVDALRDAIVVDPADFDFHFNDTAFMASQSEPLTPSGALLDILGPRRRPGEDITPHHCAVAHAVQKTLETVCVRLVDNAMARLGADNLVLSGGLTLNCVLNEKIRRDCGVDPFVLPPCGDDGTALGAALLLRHEIYGGPETPHLSYRGSYGTAVDTGGIQAFLDAQGITGRPAGAAEVAGLLAQDKTIGFMSGRYEFGPRALGFRSILADPRPKANWTRVNQDIKFREDFRPFAPIMLRPAAERYWGPETAPIDSPYMLLAPVMNERAATELGAVTHVDRTARLQTVAADFNPILHEVLSAFQAETGVGVLMNTSLNMSGESIIADFEDLVAFLACSGLDAVYLEGTLVERSANEAALAAMAERFGDRQGYLAARKQRYGDWLEALRGVARYKDFFEFYDFIYGAPLDDEPPRSAARA